MFCKYCGADNIWRKGDKNEWLLMPSHQFLGRIINDGDKEPDYVFLLSVGSDNHRDEWHPLDTDNIEQAKKRALQIAKNFCQENIDHWQNVMGKL